jgi:hypothetical protein
MDLLLRNLKIVTPEICDFLLNNFLALKEKEIIYD